MKVIVVWLAVLYSLSSEMWLLSSVLYFLSLSPKFVLSPMHLILNVVAAASPM